MSRGLEDFEELKKTTCFYCQYHINEECVNDKCIWHNVEKELKALEIIKNKNVMISLLKGARSLEHYNIQIEPFSRFDNHLTIVSKIPMPLTQEEYDLLKEVGL